jgi:putative FmdB family regulatory protein
MIWRASRHELACESNIWGRFEGGGGAPNVAFARQNVPTRGMTHHRGGIVRPVPRYDFRCRQCSATFEVERPMAAAGDPARCPSGHTDTVKLLSTVALGGRSGRAPVPAAPAGGGGCCGGGCCG